MIIKYIIWNIKTKQTKAKNEKISENISIIVNTFKKNLQNLNKKFNDKKILKKE